MNNLLEKRVIDTFEEKCSEAIDTFEKVLKKYENEKNADFCQYAIEAARETSIEIHNLHYSSIMCFAYEEDIDVFKRLLNIMHKALSIIDDIMIYRNNYEKCILHIHCKYNDTL